MGSLLSAPELCKPTPGVFKKGAVSAHPTPPKLPKIIMTAYSTSRISIGLFSACLLTVSASAATISIGNFEAGSLDGWEISGFSSNVGRSITTDTVGATTGSGSLRYNAPLPGGYVWGIQKDMNPFMASIAGSSSVILSFDITWDQAQWTTAGGNWVQIAEVAFNSAATGFGSLARDTITSDSGSGYVGGWDSTNFAGIHTRTITWDLTSLFDGSEATNPYAQLALAFNFSSDFTAGGVFYLDNIEITTAAAPIPEPSSFAALAGVVMLGVVAARRRRHSK